MCSRYREKETDKSKYSMERECPFEKPDAKLGGLKQRPHSFVN